MDLMSFQPATTTPWSHLGPAHAVAMNPGAPAREVQDASMELASMYLSELGSMEAASGAQTMRDWNRLRQAEASGNRLLAKALSFVNPDAAKAKAKTEAMLSIMGGGGLWVQKPGLPFEALRTISQRLEIVGAIHMTRRRQVAAFAEPSGREQTKGFRVHHRDASAELSEDQADYCRWLEKFILNGGREFRPHARRALERHTFREFISQFADEALTHDNVAVETVPLRGIEGLDSFYLRDGGTFFQAAPNKRGVYAYQSLQGMPDEEFSHDELVLFQRNQSPYVDRRGYGKSELESCVDMLGRLMQGIEYTTEGMDNNAIPRGILTVFGNFDRRTKEAFNAAWAAKVRGVKNRFGLPVLFSQNGQAAANFTATGQEFSEMAFAKWIAFTSSIGCAVYGMDPKEINLDAFTQGSTSNFSGDDTSEKLAAARDKGLVPFLTDTAAFLSDNIIGRFSSDYRLSFTGLEAMDAKAKREREEKAMTINELRASLSMDPHPIAWFGDLPADPGMQAAEFQRLNAVITLDEGRRIWGGLPEYPDPSVGAAPLNPSLGSLFQGAVSPAQPDPMGGMPGEDPFGAMDPGQGGGGDSSEAGGDEEERPRTFQDDVKDRLRSLKGEG